MNILIVDDDLLVRRWLTMLLEQKKLPNMTIYEAPNGVVAIEKCNQHDIDLLISDIKMPIMDGIELLTIINMKFPNIKVAVLSSYSEFDYVKPALKAGAIDYILKSEITVEDIENLLHRANQHKLFANNIHSQTLALTPKQQSDNNIMHKFIFNDSNPSLNELSISFTSKVITSVIFQIEYEKTSSFLLNTCFQAVYSAMQSEGLEGTVCNIDTNTFCFVFNNNIHDAKDKSLRVIAFIRNNLLKHANLEFRWLRYILTTNINALRNDILKLYQNALCCQYYQKNISDEYINYYTDEQLMHLKNQLSLAINQMISVNTYREIFQVIDNCLKDLHNKYVCPNNIYSVLTFILYKLYDYLLLLYGSQHSYLYQLEAMILNIYKHNTHSAMIQWVESVKQLYLLSINKEKPYKNPYIEKACVYINDNYNKKLTLSEVAKHVFINKTYLSELFKKELGVNFNDFLNETRLNKACKLMRTTDDSLALISQTCGFTDQNYFSKVFKKTLGVSPAIYRKDCAE